MASEFKRGAIRILTNYLRLAAFLILGLLYAPIFIGGIGAEAFGIIGLLGATVGIAEMFKEITQSSMNRELGAAHHHADPEVFPAIYSAAVAIAAALAAVTGAIFVGLYAAIALLDIPEDLRYAAGLVVIAMGVRSVTSVLFAPQFNMLLVTERMVAYNAWLTADRAVSFVSVVLIFLVMGVSDPSDGLIWYAFMSSGLAVAFRLAAVAHVVSGDRRLIPRFALPDRRALREVAGTAGWNSVVVTAINLHIRIDQVIMNIAFGVALGNGVFTLAVTLTGYVRMLATGITGGLDVVTARVASGVRGSMSMETLLESSTRMHAVVALPAGALVLLMAGPFMGLWVGRQLQDPVLLERAIVLTQVLVIGMTARAISDSWVRILYGAGHIRRYAPLILAGGLSNPVMAVALIMLLPERIGYLGPAIAFSGIFLGINFLLIPRIVAQSLHLSVVAVFRPMLRPAAASLLSAGVLLVPAALGLHVTWSILAGTILLFGMTHAAATWWLVLRADERGRLVRTFAGRLRGA